MRFKIDEHLPVEIKELLTHHQHDAVTVPDEGMAGAVDPDVGQACQKEARALVTLDLDFSEYALTHQRITRALSSSVLHYRASLLSFG
jgi:predicted nuclease of predicted toxin-antitoxin system